MSCHSLLQGIWRDPDQTQVTTQGSDQTQVTSQESDQTQVTTQGSDQTQVTSLVSVSLAGVFFTTSAPWKAYEISKLYKN